jgi:uncharacterized protein YndB with AHSA1/START domain
MNTQENIEDRTLTLKRTISAPLEPVWDAWTKPERIAKWWGPKGMQVNIAEHDFRIGGQWRYTMEMPDGNTFVSDGTYADIEPQKKLVTSADFRPMTIGVVLEILFEEDGNGTNLEFHVLHPTMAYRKQQEGMGFYKGWDAAFDRLENYLGQLSGASTEIR